MTHLAWEILCWFALVAGCFSMGWAKRKIELATEVMNDATHAYRNAAAMRLEILAMLEREATEAGNPPLASK